MRSSQPMRSLFPLVGLFAGSSVALCAATSAVHIVSGPSEGPTPCATLCAAPLLIQAGGGYGGGGRTDPRDRGGSKGGTSERGGSSSGASDSPDRSEIEPSWLERMPAEDRQPLEACIGFAAPAFPSGMGWINGEPLTWEALRGKVVVIQSWTGRTAGGRAQPQKAKDALKGFDPNDVVLLALHVPEGADKADEVARNAAKDIRVVVDPSGAFCDSLGIYKRPVNLVVDRDGAVRAVGLTQQGLTKAVDLYVKRPVAPDAAPPSREEPKAPTPAEVRWPTFNQPVTSARDLRGQQGPGLHVADWYVDPTGSPSGRMLLVDFFASWCGPCLAAIPHMNDLARRYQNDVFVLGLSDESKRNLSDGLLRRNRKASDFAYAVGVDPSKRMYNAFAVRGIPHCAIISTDGIVRWQGHPTQLTPAVMDQLVSAHRAANASTGSAPSKGPAKRWEAETRSGRK